MKGESIAILIVVLFFAGFGFLVYKAVKNMDDEVKAKNGKGVSDEKK